jgi:uncharacterized Tic20 family protein
MAIDFRVMLVVFAVVWIAMVGITVFSWVVAIMAMVKASRGEEYRYPLTVRLVKV